jgi:hypothetical protein
MDDVAEAGRGAAGPVVEAAAAAADAPTPPPAVPCSSPRPAEWPADGRLTPEWVTALCATLEHASRLPPAELPAWLPAAVLDRIIGAGVDALSAEETLVEVQPPPGASVTVVGDTHGQLHDVLRLFDVAGTPSADALFILNGDFVDRCAEAARERDPRALARAAACCAAPVAPLRGCARGARYACSAPPPLRVAHSGWGRPALPRALTAALSQRRVGR